MDMGMMKQRLRPRMEDREKANVGAEMLGVSSDLEERLRGGAEENRIDDLFVSQGESGDLGRHREDDMEVGDREKLRFPLREPCCALMAETGGAMAIAAGVVGWALGAARVATIKVSPERGRMAAPQGRQDGVLRRRNPRASRVEQGGTEPVNDVAQRGRVPVHGKASLLRRRALEVLDRVERALRRRHQLALHVRVDRRCR